MPPRWVTIAFLVWLGVTVLLTVLVTLHRHQTLSP
jgi:hypothetical protein